MIGRLLFRVSPRLSMAYWTVRARIKYGVAWRITNCIYFMKLASHCLRGRLLIIDTQRPTSNGGYRYYAIIISKRPLSSSNTYEDL